MLKQKSLHIYTMLPKSKILHFGLILILIINSIQAKPSKDTEETKDVKTDTNKGELLLIGITIIFKYSLYFNN